jgi:hypothetical protein
MACCVAEHYADRDKLPFLISIVMSNEAQSNSNHFTGANTRYSLNFSAIPHVAPPPLQGSLLAL